MWEATARLAHLGLPLGLVGLPGVGARARLVGAIVDLSLDGAPIRRVPLLGDVATMARVVSGEWTWTPKDGGAQLRRLVDGQVVATIPHPGLLGFAAGGPHVVSVGSAGSVSVRAGEVEAIPGRWAQAVGDDHVVLAGRDGLARWDGALTPVWGAPVGAVRVAGPWVAASSLSETALFLRGERRGALPWKLDPGLPAAWDGRSLWLAIAEGSGVVQVAPDAEPRQWLSGATALSMAAGPLGLAVVAAGGMGDGRVVVLHAGEVTPGPAVDPWIACVCWSGDHLVCGGVRELLIARWVTG